MKSTILLSFTISAFCLFIGEILLAQSTKAPANEMSWWYDKPASKYWEGMPIATGRFAAMILGKTGEEQIVLNEETLWSGGPNNPNNPDGPRLLKEMQQCILNKEYLKADSISTAFNSRPMRVQHYQPMGNLNLLFDQNETKVQNYRRKLSMDSSLVTITYLFEGVAYKREIFASYPDQVIVMRITSSKPGSINVTGWMNSLQPSAVSTLEKGDLILKGGTRDLTEESYKDRKIPGKIKWQARVRVQNEGGKVSYPNISKDRNLPGIKISGASTVTFVMAGATNWVSWKDVSGNEKERCDNYLANASRKSYENLKKRHTKDYCPLFNSCRINLGTNEAATLNTSERMEQLRKGSFDPQFVAQYFQYGRYLMLAGAREKTLAFNNHNIWLNNMEGRWQGRWTLNINIQECYWPVESTNLSGLNESMLTFTEQLAQAGERTAREMYNCRGWVAHHGTDVWFNTAPTDGHPNASMWPMGGAWIMQQLFDHYLYNPDESYLKRIYPLLKGASEFFLDYLITDPKSGWLVTCPSSSPENWFFSGNKKETALSMGSSMDNQIIRNLFRNTIRAGKELGYESDLQTSLEKALARLPPHQIGKLGQLQEWIYDFEETDVKHRHMSQLFAFYPDDDITIYKTPELAKAVEKVLERKDDKYLGWSGAWKINLYARLQKPEAAYEILDRMLVDVSIHPREEDSKVTPSFEGNQAIQGVTAGVVEMLMQSHSGEISLLPALPKAWKSGKIIGLQARGGFGVDIEWENSQLKESVITSKFSQICRIRCKAAVEIITGKESLKSTLQNDGTLEFEAKAGQKYRITIKK
jgi:alpha-L-fucosidase 2